MGYPDIWGVKGNSFFMDTLSPGEVGLVQMGSPKRTLQGYVLDSVHPTPESAELREDTLRGMGYKTAIVEQDAQWLLYKKM